MTSRATSYLGLVLIFFISFKLYGQNIYLANYDRQSNSFLLSDSMPFNVVGVTDNTTLGMCVSFGECKRFYLLSEAYKKNFARMSGVYEIPADLEQYYKFPDYNVEVTSKVIKNEKENSLVEVETTILGEVVSRSILKLEKLNLEINLNPIEISTPRRSSYSEQSSDFKNYSKSVFQILALIDDGLTSGSSHGTGFFISSSGFALTNLHVMKLYPECLARKSCQIEIKQVADEIIISKVKSRVLICSNIHDFCLLQLNGGSQLQISPLPINLSSISSELMTLGFPGDKLVPGTQEVDLTYSFGSPVGFFGNAVSSSIYASGGASGSPIIDLKNGSVIGINSNVAETFSQNKDGAPAIFRTLHLIERDFDITGYLAGSKQSKIEQIILKIKKSDNLEDCKRYLREYSREKSYYGESKLKVLSYSHSNRAVRKEIVRFLSENKDHF